MTPSPSNPNDQDRQQSANSIEDQSVAPKPMSLETAANLRDKTPPVTPLDREDELPDELSDEERVQARAALAFLGEVRIQKELRQTSETLPPSIGRYSILRSLGRGGFAEVFLAEDQELSRRVALKVPLFDSAINDAGRQRFEREARLAASLGHPQIVPVYEYGDLGPVRYIAFGWCDGSTLGQWIDEHGPLEFETAAKIVEHLAQAVQHAHQRGIIHRDLKPGNILVDSSRESRDKPVWERLRITDFGLARNFDNHDATLTRDGQLVGTPAYMAPEQAGSGADIGPGADIWALGMILFELLTGELPFRKPEMLATIRAICDEQMPKAKKLRRDVPVALDAIADLCLRKAPAERFETAHALAADLKRYSAGEPVKAKPQSALSTFAMWARRNPVLAGSIGLTFASLVIGMSVSIWQRNVAIANLNEANSQTSRADGNLETAQAVINSVVHLEKKMRMQSQLSQERADLVQRTAAFQVALIEDEVLTPNTRYETAMSLKELSTLLFQLGRMEAAEENARFVVSLLTGLEDNLPEGVTAAQIFGAKVQQRLRIIAALNAQNRLDESLELCEETEADTIPEGADEFRIATILAENLRAKAMIQQVKGNIEDAAKTLVIALSTYADIEPIDEKQVWSVALARCKLTMNLATCEMSFGALDASEAHFLDSLEAIEAMKEVYPNHNQIAPNLGIVSFQLGTLYERLKKLNSAIEFYQKSRNIHLAMFEQNPNFPNPGNMYVLSSVALARVHAALDQDDESQSIAAETIDRATTFPKQLKANDAFKDNLGILKSIVREAD